MSAPHQIRIPQLFVSPESALALEEDAGRILSWTLSEAQASELDLLMNGGLFPLKGFLSQADYDSVLSDMQLSSGQFWPMPLTLDVTTAFADDVEPGMDIALRDCDGAVLAIMSVTDKWRPDREHEARTVFASSASTDPRAQTFLQTTRPIYLGGKVKGIRARTTENQPLMPSGPNGLRSYFHEHGAMSVAFHAIDERLDAGRIAELVAAARDVQAKCLIHLVADSSIAGQADDIAGQYATADNAASAIQPFVVSAEHLRPGAGLRYLLWLGLIARNHGATHVLIPRDTNLAPHAREKSLRQLSASLGSRAGVTFVTL
ncbi:hypothetical protein PAF17_10255 [Paracoccus sp. Z330]|uniref:ATP-sulfurylase PUA-like domain-containing protein n=1 Tax=Paracoccus onchidii TaxID=3017813 RepID=A0ABT4ZET0_9RHOB|nr:hypothetical protein [Paracoccus onchidii]MDB6177883.1 hypothetical protein [Paracoccus onchidii]